jgi:lipoprotein-releasing system permease protein
MYKLQLISKYLVKRRIAWVALVAVMLCTAMVLIVISVMGGWLNNFKESFHSIEGDVVVTGESLSGFPYYQEMIDKIKTVPGVVAAIPVIRSGAVINIKNEKVAFVQVTGYPPDVGDVIPWPATLHRQANAKVPNFDLLDDVDYSRFLPPKAGDPRARIGIIVSSPVAEIRHETPTAQQEYLRQQMLTWRTTLTMLPVAGGEAVEATNALVVPCWIVDDSKSRIWQLDNDSVYMSFADAQSNLKMGPSKDSFGNPIPARCSQIEIKTAPGADLNAVRDRVELIADQVDRSHFVERYYGVRVQTWLDAQGHVIKAVENEKTIMTILFGVISSVAVLLIFCIFYMIVLEKTKDIGILKSVGASSVGILSLFLWYGLAIGVVGSGLGWVLAYYFCRYDNQINELIGKYLGQAPFNPETYQFDSIPSKLDPQTVVWTITVAILSALVGALLPALRAATMNPIDALRYE